MRHSFLDKYSELDSPIHRMDLRVKLGVFLVLLIVFAAVPMYWEVFVAALILLLGLFLLSRIPLAYVVRRALVILPFLLFIIVFIPLFQEQTWLVAWHTFARAICSVLTLILFVSTTRFHVLLQVLDDLGMPRMIVQVLSFIYRFFFVLIGELERMELASRARAPRRGKMYYYKALSRMLGMLVIRSYERSERVYQAMQLRGYDSEGTET